jgi:hypothetical protein
LAPSCQWSGTDIPEEVRHPEGRGSRWRAAEKPEKEELCHMQFPGFGGIQKIVMLKFMKAICILIAALLNI